MMLSNHPANETPQKFYILVSIFHFLGGVTSKMALTYISYPVHVLGKGGDTKVYSIELNIKFFLSCSMSAYSSGNLWHTDSSKDLHGSKIFVRSHDCVRNCTFYVQR